MAKANVNGIQLEYDTFGERSGRPLLLIIGMGDQMINWSEEVCNQLADEGHFVIRFDNRDSGLSSRLKDMPVADPMEAIKARMEGKSYKPPYDYYDMGDDAAGLLDFLGIAEAHICGISMGAAIAHTVVISHPSKVSSVISISGTTGNPNLPQMKPEIFGLFAVIPFCQNRDLYVDSVLNLHKKTRGSGYPIDEARDRKISAEGYERSFYPDGLTRQFVAAFGRSRLKALASITTPTLVIHGDEDPVIPIEGGKDTAERIPGAELMIIRGMGHDQPYGGFWPQIVKAIAAHTSKAQK